MTSFEKELRAMLVPTELDLLDRYLGSTETRDGAIADLVACKLRDYAKTIDRLNGNG